METDEFDKVIAFRISMYNTKANIFLMTPAIKRDLGLIKNLEIEREKMIQFIVTNKKNLKIDELVSDVVKKTIRTNNIKEILEKINESNNIYIKE